MKAKTKMQFLDRQVGFRQGPKTSFASKTRSS